MAAAVAYGIERRDAAPLQPLTDEQRAAAAAEAKAKSELNAANRRLRAHYQSRGATTSTTAETTVLISISLFGCKGIHC